MGFPKRYDASTQEPHWQALWAAAGLYNFSHDDLRPMFAIDTPPPTVSGNITIGHVYSYVQAEAMARFWRMQGYNVYYPFGFDDNGLPTERFVEKTLGIRGRDLPRPEFIQACLQVSQQVEERFEQFWKRLGFSVDWRLRYSTIDPHARRISQWSFIDLYQKGRIERAQAPNPWCVECQTAIAQAEIDDALRPTTFYTIAFALVNQNSSSLFSPTSSEKKERKHITIATTRPELLPACVAIFVHPDDERYADLIGREAIVPLSDRRVPILADTGADPEKGSGAVMCCTFGDSADVAWWRNHDLPLIPLVSRQGTLGPDAGPYQGLSLAEARRRILADLEAQGWLTGTQQAEQSVRIHERCKTPLEILETSQWFIRVLDKKNELLEAGRQMTWHPEYMRTRYEHWVENLSWEWSISRQRFYGVPFPLWHCNTCGGVVLADMQQLPVDPSSDSPPRPCSCGSTDLRPEADVMDTWATSSVSPLIAAGLAAPGGHTSPLDEPWVQRLMPMQLRPQGHDIIRTWAFGTITKSLFHTGQIPWETLMISGHALAPDGTSIHKSLGNNPIEPDTLIERYSADALRYWACATSLGADLAVSEEEMRQAGRLCTKLWNAARLLHSQGAEVRGQGSGGGESRKVGKWESGRVGNQGSGDEETGGAPQDSVASILLPPDRAMLSWLQTLITQVTSSYKRYDYAAARELIERFFWDSFCDDYLEWIKARLYDGTAQEHDAALATAMETMHCILTLLAPIMPHVTEAIYQHLFMDGEAPLAQSFSSVHQLAWPQPDPMRHDAHAEELGLALRAIGTAVRRRKSEQHLSPAAPLAKLQLMCNNAELRGLLEQSQVDLRSLTRAQSMSISADMSEASQLVAEGLAMEVER